MTCRSSTWSVLLQDNLFHTATWASLWDLRHVPCCVSGSWSLKQEIALTKLVMTSWLCCGLLPANQMVSWWAGVKYRAWGPVHSVGRYCPPCGSCYHWSETKLAFMILDRLPCIPQRLHGHSQERREKFSLVCAGGEVSEGWHWFS